MRLYVFLMAFPSAFALSSSLPIYLVYLSLLVLWSLFCFRIDYRFIRSDYFLIGFLFIAQASFIINSLFLFGGAGLGLGHVVAYLISVFGFYFVVRGMLSAYFKLKSRESIFAIIYYTTAFVSVFVIIEFFLKAYLMIPIDNYIPRPAVKELEVLALGYFRARGFAEEPGHQAFYLEVMGPLAAYYLYSHQKYVSFAVFLCVYFVSILFTFSVASFLILPTSVIIVSTIYVLKKRNAFKKVHKGVLLFFALFLFALFNLFSFYEVFSIKDIVDQVVSKASTSSTSGSDRVTRFHEFVNVFSDSSIFHLLFGFGPGAYKNLGINSVVSLYPTLLLETGILGLLFFLLFLLSLMVDIFRKTDLFGYFVAISFLSCVLHFIFISNYWYPWFWFLAALIVSLRRLTKHSQTFTAFGHRKTSPSIRKLIAPSIQV